MDEIQTRLQETSQNCLKTYAEWVGKKRDHKAQEELQAAIHELRKVASRLEIDLAVSERDQMTARHIPIPSHRSVKDGNSVEEGEFEDDGQQDFGNSGQQQARTQHTGGGAQQRRRPMQQQRRPMQQGGGGGSPSGGGQQ
jgi:hypothetical protein